LPITVEIIVDYGLVDVVADRLDAGVCLGEQVAMRIGPDIPMHHARCTQSRLAADLLDIEAMPECREAYESAAAAGKLEELRASDLRAQVLLSHVESDAIRNPTHRAKNIVAKAIDFVRRSGGISGGEGVARCV
jgi:hypothetical protein